MGPMLGVSKKQFSLTRAALSTMSSEKAISYQLIKPTEAEHKQYRQREATTI
jgi:hypothetical protein